MSVPAIIRGDANSVLRLPASRMRDANKWSQTDSDVIAHFIQVQGQIQHSEWNASEISFTTQSREITDADFPGFEQFVYVAVYFRQFTTRKDNLLGDAVDRYLKFADCPIRSLWIDEERKCFDSLLDDNSHFLQTYTFRELFDAFLYGAGLLHKTPHPNSPHRENFRKIYDTESRVHVLFALNMSIKLVLNHVANIAVVLYRDFGHWLNDYSIPKPDIRWHHRIFETDIAK